MKLWQKLFATGITVTGTWVVIGGLSYGAADEAAHPILRHMADSTAAAWVQALGSVAAILWGIWLYQAEAGRRRDERLKRDREFGSSFTEIVSLVAAQLRGAEQISQHKDLRDGEFSEVTFDRLRFANEFIADFPAEALAGARLAHEAITARSRIGQAIRRCEEFNRSQRQPASAVRLKELEAIRKQISRLREQFEVAEISLRSRYPASAHIEIDRE